MRILFALVFVVSAAAQTPLVRILNVSRPASGTFQVGDKFEVLLAAAAFQPVSVRTTRNGHTDWGPMVGSTDSTGRWSIAGQFTKSDFGDWSEVWTVGGKLANPAIQFQVNAPCLPGGPSFASSTGLHMALTCETAEGSQSFSTASDSFKTPDGRLIAAPSSEQTQDEYQMGILQYLITAQQKPARPVSLQSSKGARGDETSELVMTLIGVNALNDGEIRNVLEIIRDAFQKPETIAPGAKYPARTLKLLRHLATFVSESRLKLQIAETFEYVQTR